MGHGRTLSRHAPPNSTLHTYPVSLCLCRCRRIEAALAGGLPVMVDRQKQEQQEGGAAPQQQAAAGSAGGGKQ